MTSSGGSVHPYTQAIVRYVLNSPSELIAAKYLGEIALRHAVRHAVGQPQSRNPKQSPIGSDALRHVCCTVKRVAHLLLHAMCCFVGGRRKLRLSLSQFVHCAVTAHRRACDALPCTICDDAAGCHGWPTLCKRRRIRLSSPMPSGTRLAPSESGSSPRALWRPAPPLRCGEKHGEVFVVSFSLHSDDSH